MSKIELRDCSVAYWGDGEQSTEVLHELNLTINPGETVLITGDSGCGKTTLLRCLNGLVPNFFDAEIDGEIMLAGETISDQEPREIARKVGMVFQDPRAEFFTYDVTSELAFTCENYGFTSADIQHRITQVAAQVGIENLLGRKMAHLSSGEKQKIAVAAALMLEPEVLLFDEPSANLDLDGLQMLTEVMARLKAQGCTIVVADHRLSYLAPVLDRCLILADGRLTDELSAAELAQKDAAWFVQRGLRKFEPSQNTWPTGEYRGSHDGYALSDLRFKYLGRDQLWQISQLDLPESGVIGIVGPNGCGKTTFVKALMGLLKFKSGRLMSGGRSWPKRARLRDCAYVMQDVDYQLMGESVWAELFIGLDKDEAAADRAAKLLDIVGLADFRERHPLTLSGGQKQRLGIALAAMKGAKVVCLDEPTSGLDAKNMRRVSALIKELAELGALVLVITHDKEFAEITCQNLLVFDSGDAKLRSHLAYAQ